MHRYFYTLFFTISLLISFSNHTYLYAHSGKARFHVIVDVDGAADDLRALCMLLANREIEVLSIMTSNGALPPAETAKRVSALLNEFHNEGIPVGMGREVITNIPQWRDLSQSINWSDSTCSSIKPTDASTLIYETLANEDNEVIYIALGSLTNVGDFLKANPNMQSKIKKIIWYCDISRGHDSANYKADINSASEVLRSGIHIDVISMNHNDDFVITKAFIDSLSSLHNQYSDKIVDTHTSAPLNEVVAMEHMRGWDDLTIVYLFSPELFLIKDTDSNSNVLYYLPKKGMKSCIAKSVIDIFRGKNNSESRVLQGFPTDHSLYRDDVAAIIDSTIHRYGISEWRAAVITNELHGHLGIYATIGVKMGIRAREYFNIGVDDIHVISLAGSSPPVSCLNDGLQVATGGTLGHGLITVSQSDNIRPEAIFRFKNKTLRMKLKDKYTEIIRNDIKRGVEIYGDSEEYWNYVRALAIKYWKDFDRHIIFEMYEN